MIIANESDVTARARRVWATAHDAASGPAPAADVTGPWYSLERGFVVHRGDATLPRPPTTGKAEGPRPRLEVLSRKP